MARRRRAGLIAVAVCAVGLFVIAGCGGGGSDDRLTKDEYLEEFIAIGDDLEASFDELIDADVEDDFGKVADLADDLGNGLEELAGRLDDLAPPEEVEATHDKLVTGIEDLAGWAHELADKVRTAPAAELVDVLKEYGFPGELDPETVPGAAEVQEAVAEFEEKGYSFSGDSETYATEGPGDAEAGRAIFHSAGCSGCHTLADAPASGVIGPDLDAAKPPYGKVVERVTNGRGVMPAFGSQLSEQEIQNVAAYVSSVAGG